MRPLFVRKPRFRTQASRILLTSASSLIHQKSIMQSRSVPSVGSSLSRLIYSFVCVFVCLFYLFFFYPSPSETRRLFLLEQRPGRCDGRAESQHKEQKSTGKHLFYMCDCCPVSHLNEKKAEVVNLSRVWMSLKEDPLDKFLLLFCCKATQYLHFVLGALGSQIN